MTLYHGTSDSIATTLASSPNLVSVTRGGGELGRGFYAGDHVALAAAWARGRHAQPAVLEIQMDPSAYVRLAILVLNWVQVVSTWNQLRTSGTTHSYTFNWDVVHGPLATLQHATQHKFESSAAEAVLRRSAWRKL